MGELLLPTLHHVHEVAPSDPAARDEITAFHGPNHELGDHPEATYFRAVLIGSDVVKEEVCLVDGVPQLLPQRHRVEWWQ